MPRNASSTSFVSEIMSLEDFPEEVFRVLFSHFTDFEDIVNFEVDFLFDKQLIPDLGSTSENLCEIRVRFLAAR